MDDAFKRASLANVATARTLAQRIAKQLDHKYGTNLAYMEADKLLGLLKIRAVALKHYAHASTVVDLIQRQYANREANTGLGVRFAVLVSDKALAYADKELGQRLVRRVLSKATGWTGKGLANLPDAVLAGQVRGEKTTPAPVRYPYRGRPIA
jgi:hypothetical protein